MAVKRIYQNIFHNIEDGATVWTTPGCSDICVNTLNAEDFNLEVQGDAADFEVIVEGRMFHQENPDSSWSKLSVISLDGFKVLSSIKTKGIYAMGISGLAEIRLKVISLSGGSMTFIGGIGD